MSNSNAKSPRYPPRVAGSMSSEEASSMARKINQQQQQQTIGHGSHHRSSMSDIPARGGRGGQSSSLPSELSSEEEFDADDTLCNCSPLHQFCRPFMSGNDRVQIASKAVKRGLVNSDTSIASWQERAAQKILDSRQHGVSDDEMELDGKYMPASRSSAGASVAMSRGGRQQRPTPLNRPDDVLDDSESYHLPSTLTTRESPNEQDFTPSSESRIVAPHVDKLSPLSTVEVRLQSINESVRVICSVDVLKMRSKFFHEVLSEQEILLKKKKTETSSSGSGDGSWRDALIIPEQSPFEAAAFLESLHEGRAILSGDWSFAWARLSVTWQIEDLLLEYASKVDSHFNRILSYIDSNNWRLSPNVLVGHRVAMFRKGSTALPTVVTGTVIESAPSTGYSKIRVSFDSNEKPGCNTSSSASIASAASNLLLDPLTSPIRFRKPMGSNSSLRDGYFAPPSTPLPMQDSVSLRSLSGSGSSSMMNLQTNPNPPLVGDIGEPFWVQLRPPSISLPSPQRTPTANGNGGNSNQSGSYSQSGQQQNASAPTPLLQALTPWNDPDELFVLDSRKAINGTDKRVFWEMARAIMELPELSSKCTCEIRDSKDLAALIKRPEFRVLWTTEAPDILPKDAATELIMAAYVQPQTAALASEK